MKFQDSPTNQPAGTDSEESETPGDFRCIDPEQQPLVFDFLNTFSGDIKEMALSHLTLCLHCRELAATVLKVNRYLQPKTGDYLHAETQEVDAETEPV